jgi:hypothetical protein
VLQEVYYGGKNWPCVFTELTVCWKSLVHGCMDLPLDSPLCSIDLFVSISTDTTPSWCFSFIVNLQLVWVLQLGCFLNLFWLFFSRSSKFSYDLFNLLVNFYTRAFWDFVWDQFEKKWQLIRSLPTHKYNLSLHILGSLLISNQQYSIVFTIEHSYHFFQIYS